MALFAGAGGGILASRLLGWSTVCAVEIEPYRQEVLLQRQRDGVLEPFPVWDDVTTFDGRPWKGLLDVVTGGFPCQDVSIGGRGKGVRAGERSGLWREFARIVGETRPRFVFAENSPMLSSRGLDKVLQDLSGLGYDARWCRLGAWHFGGMHKRDRLFVLAYAHEIGSQKHGVQKVLGKPTLPRVEGCRIPPQVKDRSPIPTPLIRGVGDGVAHHLDRLRAVGDGQVPQVVAVAFSLLSEGLT